MLELRHDDWRKKTLGSLEWLSYAYFRAGVECQESRRSDKAIALYARALERDPDNRIALFNRAVLTATADSGQRPRESGLHTFDGDRAKAADALVALERVQKLADGSDELRREPLWYQAGYQRTAAALNVPTWTDERLYQHALDLVWQLEKGLEALEARRQWPEIKAWVEDLERVERPASIE